MSEPSEEDQLKKEIAELEERVRIKRLRDRRDELKGELDGTLIPHPRYGGVMLLGGHTRDGVMLCGGPTDVHGNPVPHC